MAAIFYDLLLLLAVLLVGTACWLPFTGGEAIKPRDPGYAMFLLGLCFLFYGWAWTHGGQTVGMRAWRLRLYACDGPTIGWRQAAVRFAAAWLSLAVFGMGYLWPLVSPARTSWHDRLSRTLVGWDEQPL